MLGLNPCLRGAVGQRGAPASPPILFWDRNAFAGLLFVGWVAACQAALAGSGRCCAGRGCLLPSSWPRWVRGSPSLLLGDPPQLPSPPALLPWSLPRRLPCLHQGPGNLGGFLQQDRGTLWGQSCSRGQGYTPVFSEAGRACNALPIYCQQLFRLGRCLLPAVGTRADPPPPPLVPIWMRRQARGCGGLLQVLGLLGCTIVAAWAHHGPGESLRSHLSPTTGRGKACAHISAPPRACRGGRKGFSASCLDVLGSHLPPSLWPQVGPRWAASHPTPSPAHPSGLGWPFPHSPHRGSPCQGGVCASCSQHPLVSCP